MKEFIDEFKDYKEENEVSFLLKVYKILFEVIDINLNAIVDLDTKVIMDNSQGDLFDQTINWSESINLGDLNECEEFFEEFV